MNTQITLSIEEIELIVKSLEDTNEYDLTPESGAKYDLAKKLADEAKTIGVKVDTE